MNHYNPNIHHRHSIRLKDFDYATPGLYFVTICSQNREMLFGIIRAGRLFLNEAGRMVERWYWETESKYSTVRCREMVVMPNHFHCIWEILGVDKNDFDPSVSLSSIVQWFKTMTTNEYIRGVKQLGWPSFKGRLWQRNYYEHIIRDEESYRAIANYIITNPIRWNGDRFHP